MVSDRTKYQEPLGVDQLSPIPWTFWTGPNTTEYQNPFDMDQMFYEPNVLWAFWTGSNICWPRTANLPDSQSHVLNPNPILPSGYPLQAPSGSDHLRHSFIHLCKFIQIERVEATRVYLHSNSTQVWEETSHLMVWKVSATSVANQRSSEKLLKAPNNTWVLFWLAVWGQRSSTMTSNKNPFLVTAPPITLPHHHYHPTLSSNVQWQLCDNSCFHRLGPQAKCSREKYNHTRARPCSRGQNATWEEWSLAAPHATESNSNVSRVCVDH